jgi:hypothetical protein
MYGIIGGQQRIDGRFDTESIVSGENRSLVQKLFTEVPGWRLRWRELRYTL